MTDAAEPKGWRAVTGHVAVRALFKSVLINLAAPALLYHFAVPLFAASSLLPLAISGIPPILWLAYSVVRLRAIDFLGLFAAENVVVSMAALLLAHTERGALIGRSMQNVILAAVFLASLATRKPLVFHMARQLATGNDPAKRQSFDQAATQPDDLHAYRILTLGWTAGLLIKAAGSYWLGAHFVAKDFLILSPVWDLLTDSVLVSASIFYGRKALAPPAPTAAPQVAPPVAP